MGRRSDRTARLEQYSVARRVQPKERPRYQQTPSLHPSSPEPIGPVVCRTATKCSPRFSSSEMVRSTVLAAITAAVTTTTTTTTTTMALTTTQVTFVRHGCTYMNEYLGGGNGGRPFGAPHFTDVFATDGTAPRRQYQDSPLSPLGVRQAQGLANGPHPPAFVEACELVVVSPLTRALQTYEIGLKPWLDNNDDDDDDGQRETRVPVMAVPEAAERLYLISDVGRPVSELQTSFPYVDFDSACGGGSRGDNASSPSPSPPWWYQPAAGEYVEWRPTGRGQNYACPGEPQRAFDERMSRLYAWIEERPEASICVVCHHGVIDWFLDMDFDNCQYRQVTFSSIQPRSLIR